MDKRATIDRQTDRQTDRINLSFFIAHKYFLNISINFNALSGGAFVPAAGAFSCLAGRGIRSPAKKTLGKTTLIN